MNYPAFMVSRFGYYDSEKNILGDQKGKSRMVTEYELEFYIDDYEGGNQFDGVFYPARSNCFSLAKPGQRCILIEPYCCYFINITTQDPELIELFAQLPAYSLLGNVEEVTNLFREMMRLENKTSLEGRLQMQSCVCRILAQVSKHRELPGALQTNTMRREKALLMVDQHIREHLDKDLSLETLAKLANMDPTYFHKLFSSVFGMTPAKRVLSYRISAAKQGLIEGSMPMSELALKCGFSSQAYFCYKFKKVVGHTPAKYRELALLRIKNKI